MQGTRRIFRSSFRILWRWTTTFCAVIGAVDFAVAILSGLPPLPSALIAVFSLLIGVSFAIAVACFPVYVSSDGIRCYDFYGFYRTVPWDSVALITQTNLFGLKYFVVSSASGWSDIYIPHFLADMPEFVLSVEEFAGTEHPLARKLRSVV